MVEFKGKTPESQNVSSAETSEWAARKWVIVRFVEGGWEWEVRAREGFHAAEEIKKIEGSAIEVAGPSDEGFFFHDITGGAAQPRQVDLFKEREVFVSNLHPGAPEFSQTGFVRFYGAADFMADARKLPVKAGRVAALFCSCLGTVGSTVREEMRRLGFEKTASRIESERKAVSERDIIEENMRLREKVIQEARRVLKDGGLLVWQGGRTNDLRFALANGFILLQAEQRKTESGVELAPKMIFQKKENIKEK